jgi:protein-disulfide isomerase
MLRFKIFTLVLVLGAGLQARSQTCPALPANKNASLVEYVQKKYRLDERSGLKIVNEQPVEGSCYRRLTFEGKSAVRTWQLSLFLSPDGRFLTSELFDTAVDPAIAERKTEQALMEGLTPNTGSSRGSTTASVTIVEFSDFECPFCRKFAGILDQLSPAERDQVRIVFHHFPLPMHPWARAAAEGAACAQLQGSDAFWFMHDQLFQNQQSITPENIKQKLREFAQASKAIDFPKFQSCLEDQMSLGLVFRDMNLASANHIDATPTLFINGHRVSGVRDATQLRELIMEAKKESFRANISDANMLRR